MLTFKQPCPLTIATYATAIQTCLPAKITKYQEITHHSRFTSFPYYNCFLVLDSFVAAIVYRIA